MSHRLESPRKGTQMKKTMVYLDEDEHLRLRYLALDQRVSMAELIRRAVRQYLKQQPRKGVRK
jgi:predicted HicB family RNase H-like nuclease